MERCPVHDAPNAARSSSNLFPKIFQRRLRLAEPLDEKSVAVVSDDPHFYTNNVANIRNCKVESSTSEEYESALNVAVFEAPECKCRDVYKMLGQDQQLKTAEV